MTTEELLVTILQKINSMDDRMANMEKKIDSLDVRMAVMETRMDAMDARVDAMEAGVGALTQQVKEIQLTLENEIRKDIGIIAEGHLDLSRKLDQALEIQKEKEMILLRITSVEGDVQRRKSRIGMTV